MESEEKKTFINEHEESQSFLQNLNVFNKQTNSKKVILKILFFLFVIAITLYSYRIKTKYYNLFYDDNCVIKNKQMINSIKNNTDMKHAIILLASYGIDYLNSFLEQFNNDSRFDIYIHIDGKTKIDIDNNKTIINANIKYCNHSFSSERYSVEMGDATYELFFIANKNYDYDYYHIMSESCYFSDSLDEFYNFFVINNFNSYINYYKFDKFLLNNKPNGFYKGSQWMSIHKNIINKLLKISDIYNSYKEQVKNGCFQSKTFWEELLIYSISKEIASSVKRENISREDEKRLKTKNDNIIFSQLLSIIDNMFDFGVDEHFVKEIIEPKIQFYKVDDKLSKTINDVMNKNKRGK